MSGRCNKLWKSPLCFGYTLFLGTHRSSVVFEVVICFSLWMTSVLHGNPAWRQQTTETGVSAGERTNWNILDKPLGSYFSEGCNNIYLRENITVHMAHYTSHQQTWFFTIRLITEGLSPAFSAGKFFCIAEKQRVRQSHDTFSIKTQTRITM